MLPETSSYTCSIHWEGGNEDYDTFSRLHSVGFPGGVKFSAGGTHHIEKPSQTNPEELFAAAVGSCMMMTILAVFSRSRITVSSYDDTPEAVLQYVERRYKITKVILRPRIVVEGTPDPEKMQTLIQKSHANCFISLSVKSEVIVEPTFVTA